MYTVRHDTELKDAEGVRQELLTAICDHAEGGFPLDISGGEPTQVALQISLAAINELHDRGIEPVPGTVLSSLIRQNADKPHADAEALV